MREFASTERPTIIGIAGGTGSGKTTVVQAITRDLGPEQVSVIQHDAYYHDRSDASLAERAAINYDHPDSLETGLLVEHLRALRDGEAVRVPVYDFARHCRLAETQLVEPRSAVIVEGILILADERLRALMDIRVFLDIDADLRILRRIRRDMEERGRSFESIVTQYRRTVRPMHVAYVQPSKQYAHIIMPEGGHNQVAIEMLVTAIRSIVSGERRLMV